MNEKTWIEIENYVKEKEWTPKDYYWKHAFLTRDLALEIQKRVGGDKDIVEAAALLHDVGKANLLGPNHEKYSAEMARHLLNKLDFPKEKIPKVLECIKYENFSSLESKILRSADSMSLILDNSGGREWYFKNILKGDSQKIIKELERSFSEIEFDFAKKKCTKNFHELIEQYE